MKIVIAPDSFKGTFSSKEAAEIIARGVKKIFPGAFLEQIPIADGGEGTVNALAGFGNGRIVKVKAAGPAGTPVDAFYGILEDGETAVIETAAASGLTLVKPSERDPVKATTYGTGELIKYAFDRGCRKFIIGLGGSAANDGGSGMAAALGVRFLDKEGNAIGFGGGELSKLDSIDCSGLDERLLKCEFFAACDVDNPLCGKNGASNVFGPQKGASERDVKLLDKCLEHYAAVLKKDTGADIISLPGAGAAGGLGGGLAAFLNARLQKGIDIILRAVSFDEKVKDADLVITGEGSIDGQTAFGKTPYGVACCAKKYNKPVIAIAGNITADAQELYLKGFDLIVSTSQGPETLEFAMQNGESLLERAAERVMRAVRIGMNLI